MLHARHGDARLVARRGGAQRCEQELEVPAQVPQVGDVGVAVPGRRPQRPGEQGDEGNHDSFHARTSMRDEPARSRLCGDTEPFVRVRFTIRPSSM